MRVLNDQGIKNVSAFHALLARHRRFLTPAVLAAMPALTGPSLHIDAVAGALGTVAFEAKARLQVLELAPGRLEVIAARRCAPSTPEAKRACAVRRAVHVQTDAEAMLECVAEREPELAQQLLHLGTLDPVVVRDRLAPAILPEDVRASRRPLDSAGRLCCDDAACRKLMKVFLSETDDAKRGSDVQSMWTKAVPLTGLVAVGLARGGMPLDAVKALVTRSLKHTFFASLFYRIRASHTATVTFLLLQKVKPMHDGPEDLVRSEHASTLARTASVLAAAATLGFWHASFAPCVDAIGDVVAFLRETEARFKEFEARGGSGELDGVALARLVDFYSRSKSAVLADGVRVPVVPHDVYGGASFPALRETVRSELAALLQAGRSGKLRCDDQLVRRREFTSLPFDDVVGQVRSGRLGAAGHERAPVDARASVDSLKPRIPALHDAAVMHAHVDFLAARLDAVIPERLAEYLGAIPVQPFVREFARHPLTALLDPVSVAAPPETEAVAPSDALRRLGETAVAVAVRSTRPTDPTRRGETMRELARGTRHTPTQLKAMARHVSPGNQRDVVDAATHFGVDVEVVRASRGILRAMLLERGAVRTVMLQSMQAAGVSFEESAEEVHRVTTEMLAGTLHKHGALMRSRHVADFLFQVAKKRGVGKLGDSGEFRLAKTMAAAMGLTERPWPVAKRVAGLPGGSPPKRMR